MEGLSSKDWNAFLDKYLETGKGETEIYFQMSDEQKRVIQEVKRSLKRISYKYQNDKLRSQNNNN